MSTYLAINEHEVSTTCPSHALRTNFSADHPVEDAGRHLTAALLRHTNLAATAVEIVEQGGCSPSQVNANMYFFC